MALNDINQMFSIVDPQSGKPTDYLMRLLRDRGVTSENLEETVAELQTLFDQINGTQITAGTGLDGGGTIGTDDPIPLDLNAAINLLSDVDTTTTPPTAGQALVWDATSSLWKPGNVASGGGGGGGPTRITSANSLFQLATTANWTVGGGTLLATHDALDPFVGTRAVYRTSGGGGVVCSYVLDLTSQFTTAQLDAGHIIEIMGIVGRWATDRDTVAMNLTFQNGAGTAVAPPIVAENSHLRNRGDFWFNQTVKCTVPVGTRRIFIEFEALLEAGATANVAVQGFVGQLHVPSTGGGGGGSAWTLINQSGAATTGSTWTYSAPVAQVDITGLGAWNELLVYARNVTTAAGGNVRGFYASVDGGATFYTASGDYIDYALNGTATNNVVWFNHGTASTAARNVWAHVKNLKGSEKTVVAMNGAVYRSFVASASDVNAIRFKDTTGANLTGGTLHIYAR